MNLNRRGLVPSIAIVIAAATLGGRANAQQGAGVLVGSVKDAATKQAIADVVVTVTSPNLQGEQTVVTDSSGGYRIPNLPSGVYSIRFDLENYRPYTRPGIELPVDTTLRLNADLIPDTLQAEEIVVVGRPPTVDVGSTSTGLHISSELTKRVPISKPGGKGSATRSFESVAEMTAGAQNDGYGVSISGTTSPENQYVIDGVSVNNPATGIIGAPLSVEFVKEVNVITGGYMPEYGHATGGILTAVTKSGSNEFHGAVWGNTAPGAFEGNRRRVNPQNTSIFTQRRLGSQSDIGFDIGGPIVKDKLWFYTGFQAANTAYYLDRSLNRYEFDAAGEYRKNADGNRITTLIPYTNQTYIASGQDYQAFGKLTYSINSRNRIVLTAFVTPSVSGGANSFAIDPASASPEVGSIAGPFSALAHKIVSNSFNTSLKWTTESEDKKILVDTTLGWHHSWGGTYASDGSRIGSTSGLATVPSVIWRKNNPGPHSITNFEPGSALASACSAIGNAKYEACPVIGYQTGGPGGLDQEVMDRYQARSVLTYFFQGLGHHVAKAGADSELTSFEHARAYTGGRVYRESSNGGSFAIYRDYGYLTSPDTAVELPKLQWKTRSMSIGGFLQDSWSLFDKVTVNYGLRYDSQFIMGPSGAIGLSLPNQVSPRVGVIWDPTQSGHAKVYVHYARFYESVPLQVADRSLSGEPGLNAVQGGKGCDPRNGTLAPGCGGAANRVTTGSPSSPDRKWSVVGAGGVPIDPSLKPQSTDEFIAGADYDLFKNGRVSVAYTRRWMNSIVEDMSRDEAQTYFIGNPGRGMARDFPKAVRNYDALTFSLQKIFSDKWLATASYTLAYLRGNYGGLFRAETGQLDPNITSDFDLRSLMVNRYGPLPGDSRHQFKAFAARDFELGRGRGIQLGGSFRASSGGPTNVLGSHPIYGGGEVFILPRGSGERLPWVTDFGAHLAYTLKFGPTQNLTVSIDVFNLFNFQTVTSINETYTRSDVQPIPDGTRAQLPGSLHTSTSNVDTIKPSEVNPDFGKPTSYQTPRYLRFGLRTEF